MCKYFDVRCPKNLRYLLFPQKSTLSVAQNPVVSCSKLRCLTLRNFGGTKLRIAVAQNPVARCSIFRCPLLKILLPVVINFVARGFSRRCPSFFQALPVVFYADGRRHFRQSALQGQQKHEACVSFALSERGNNRDDKSRSILKIEHRIINMRLCICKRNPFFAS